MHEQLGQTIVIHYHQPLNQTNQVNSNAMTTTNHIHRQVQVMVTVLRMMSCLDVVSEALIPSTAATVLSNHEATLPTRAASVKFTGLLLE